MHRYSQRPSKSSSSYWLRDDDHQDIIRSARHLNTPRCRKMANHPKWVQKQENEGHWCPLLVPRYPEQQEELQYPCDSIDTCNPPQFEHEKRVRFIDSPQAVSDSLDMKEMIRILQSLSAKEESNLEAQEISLASYFSMSSSYDESSDENSADPRQLQTMIDPDDEISTTGCTIDPSIDSCQSTITCQREWNDNLSFLYPEEPWETLSETEY